MSEAGETKTSTASEPVAGSLIGQQTPTLTPDPGTITETGEKKVEAVVEEKKTEVEAQAPLTADSIKIPEGMTVDEAIRDEFLGVMNNAELTPQARAQALIDLQAKVVQAASERGSKAAADMQTEWIKEANTQFGMALVPMLGNIAKLVDQFGGTAEQVKELRDVFTLTGAGNHPAMVRFLDNVGKPLREGQARSGAPSSQGRTAGEILYPTMPKGEV